MLVNLTKILSWAYWLVYIFVILYGGFALYVYFDHEKSFGGKRLSRDHDKCPTSSKMNPPDIRDWKSNQILVLESAKEHPNNFADCELLNQVKDVDHNKVVHQHRMRESMRASLMKPKANVLDMDHIYLTYFQLLWAFTFVGPCSMFLWKKGVKLLKLRVFLVEKIGHLKIKPVDYDALVGKIVLEQSQAIHYFAKTEKGSKLGNIAVFFLCG